MALVQQQKHIATRWTAAAKAERGRHAAGRSGENEQEGTQQQSRQGGEQQGEEQKSERERRQQSTEGGRAEEGGSPRQATRSSRGREARNCRLAQAASEKGCKGSKEEEEEGTKETVTQRRKEMQGEHRVYSLKVPAPIAGPDRRRAATAQASVRHPAGAAYWVERTSASRQAPTCKRRRKPIDGARAQEEGRGGKRKGRKGRDTGRQR